MYNSVAEAEAWARAHPNKTVGEGGPSWRGWCAALMFWAGGFDRSCETALAGSYTSSLQSTDVTESPRGAFHWWRFGTEGHVAMDLDGGGLRLLMASEAVDNFGDGIGTISFSAYGRADYAGWSLDFVGQSLADASAAPPQGGSAAATVDSGFVIQRIALQGGYSGPVDGFPGPNTWRAVQTVLRAHGYEGPLDGVPGPNTYKALQRLARLGGYVGPIDGVPGPYTYAGLARWLG